jgi:ABC-type uncharacterized transport system substrate-binding protein
VLREVIRAPIVRVGVIYRPAFRKFVARQTALAAKEHIELVSVSVLNDMTAPELRDALHGLAEKSKVDAVWCSTTTPWYAAPNSWTTRGASS